MQLALAVLLALVSAAAYAWGALLQRELAASGGSAASRRALPALGANVLGAGLHVLALHLGPLMLIQPLGALSLVIALPWAARAEGRRVPAAQWRSAVLVLAGLDAVVVLGAADVVHPASGGQALALVATTAVGLAAALLVARRLAPRPVAAGVVLGCGSGLASAVGSTLTQTWTHQLSAGRSVLAPSMLAVLLAVVALACAGLLLAQAAYRSGLAAPLAAANSSNVVVAALVGGLLLGTTVAGGALVLLVVAVVAAGVGIVGLTRPAQAPGSRSPTASCRQNSSG